MWTVHLPSFNSSEKLLTGKLTNSPKYN